MAQSLRAYAKNNDIVRGVPRKFWYQNPTITATSNWMVEFHVSTNGSDVIDGPEKGLTPKSPFKTVQACLNYIQTFHLMGVWPVCRIRQGTYQGRIELTGGPFGQQMNGGGPILVQGTGAIPGSPWNGDVSYVAGISDVKLLSEVGGSLVSTINSGYLMFQGLQAGADGWVFSATQNGLNQIAGGVEIIAGPSGVPSSAIMSLQGGQTLIGTMKVSTGFSTAFAQGVYGGQVNFSGGQGSIVFSNAPNIPTVIDLSYNSIGQMGNANIFSGTISGSGVAARVSFNATLNTNGTSASIPHGSGGGCFTSTGGQIN